jgi:hypothetical protein
LKTSPPPHPTSSTVLAFAPIENPETVKGGCRAVEERVFVGFEVPGNDMEG